MQSQQAEVLVVGAGPVGMFSALLLAREGVNVRIIDLAPGPARDSYACGLHARTLRLLREVGLDVDLVKVSRRIDALVFYEAQVRRTRIDLARMTPDFPNLLTVPQSTLEMLLEQKLNEAGVRIQWEHRLAELRSNNSGLIATIEKLCGTATGYDVPRWETVVEKKLDCSAQFVIGTDGQHSAVRRLLNIGCESLAKPELFVVYEFESDAAPSNEMSLVLDVADTNVLWPLPEGRCRWSFQWTATEPDGEFPLKNRSALWFEDKAVADRTRKHLQDLLAARAPWFRGSIGEVDWATDVQFEHRLAERFGAGRCWLAGDAVHQTGPAGVQSMNVGFREAEALTRALLQVMRRSGSTSLLQEYEQRFRAEWRRLLGVTAKIQPAASAREPLLHNTSALASCLPVSGDELDGMLGALGFQLKSTEPPNVAKKRNAVG